MICPNCGHETGKGSFCTNCGVQLPEVASTLDSESASTNPSYLSQQDPTRTDQDGALKQEPVDKLKNAGTNFVHFFITLVKHPSEAKKANSNDFVSSIITIVLYALLLALGSYFVLNTVILNTDGLMNQPELSFFDIFLLPFIAFIVLFLAVTALTFAGVRISGQTLTFLDVLGKYGAYLLPYVLLYVIGVLIVLLNISALSGVFVIISLIGALMIVPTFILLEQPTRGFDLIYTLIGLYFVSFVIFSFFLQTFARTLVNSMLGGMMGGFGGF